METDFDLARRARIRITVAIWCGLTLTLLSSASCALVGSQSHWYPPAPYEPALTIAATGGSVGNADSHFQAGRRAEAAGSPACIDHYFCAATLAWPDHSLTAATDNRFSGLYRSSVQLFVEAATRFGRFDRHRGVLLSSGQLVPACYHGFVWQPDDFSTMLPVGTYDSSTLSNRHVACDVGVPYVALSTNPPRHRFTDSAQPFAATVVVSPAATFGGAFALQFYDPLRMNATESGLPLARDLTAPIAYAASQESDAWLENFLRPGRNDSLDGLHMREPFQPGKIPVVFVHGLASDPLAWAQLENDLRTEPAIFNRFQFWSFRYDTGDPFLTSAARLRRQLAELRQTFDPLRCDPNLSQIVLVGHSMGGLLSKMQVTHSGDAIWRSAATRPFETVVTDHETRARLAEAFFFSPSPDVKRVIYIATPHRGSVQAQRCIGRISSALVEERPESRARHTQLSRDNPGLFRPELSHRVPTSIDLLEPGSLVLQSTQCLPYGYGVRAHSIIGNDRWTIGEGPSDGVVPVSSARIAGVQSELIVDARHTQVQRHPNTVREVICILTSHAAMSGL